MGPGPRRTPFVVVGVVGLVVLALLGITTTPAGCKRRGTYSGFGLPRLLMAMNRKRRIAQYVPASGGDAREAGPIVPETGPSSDAVGTEFDAVQGRASTDFRRKYEEN